MSQHARQSTSHRCIDLNADLGEGVLHEGVGADPLLMPHLSSANIACGGHAGDEASMAAAIRLALEHRVAPGAHPSYDDREHFGRRPVALTAGALTDLVAKQLETFRQCARRLKAKVQHMKPHGALYHAAAREESVAEAVVRAVRWIDPGLIIYGPPGSALERVAAAHGLRFAAEAFPDRAYRDDGSLVPRSETGAVISDPAEVAARALTMVREGRVRSINGRWISLRIDTLSLHGDHPGAVAVARAVREALGTWRIELRLENRPPPLRIEALGEDAFRIVCGHGIDPETHARVQSLDRQLAEKKPEGVVEVVPGYADLAVFLAQPGKDPAFLDDALRPAPDASTRPNPAPGQEHVIPVCYGGEFGPDLEALAGQCDLTQDELVRRHSAQSYPVYLTGFSPGFCYLGGLDETLHAPRRANPRVRVPAGSVAVAGAQTGIYSIESPGGWNILGRTPASLFDPLRAQPFLIQAGDTVRFQPVSAETFSQHKKHSASEDKPDAVPAHTSASDAWITVDSPGLLTTVQDTGRTGFRRWGVPVGGAMDLSACRRVNALLGQGENAAVLEATMTGPTLRFGAKTRFAISGADLNPSLNGSPLANDRVHEAHPGDVLAFGPLTSGCRACIGFSGGIDVPVMLGSRSTCLPGKFGGHEGRALRAGDRLFLGNVAQPDGSVKAYPVSTSADSRDPIRILAGPEADWFTPEALRDLLSTPYRISPDSNRVGYRLEGAVLTRRFPDREMISSPVTVGTIQVTRGGLPVILLADAPTVGGYPRIGFVIRDDLPRLAQKRPGEEVRFAEMP